MESPRRVTDIMREFEKEAIRVSAFKKFKPVQTKRALKAKAAQPAPALAGYDK